MVGHLECKVEYPMYVYEKMVENTKETTKERYIYIIYTWCTHTHTRRLVPPSCQLGCQTSSPFMPAGVSD